MAPKLSFLSMMMIPFLLAAAPPAFSEHRGFRTTMIRRERPINYTRAAQQSHERHSKLAARLAAAAGGASTQTPLQQDDSGSAYDMEISIGTPPLKLSAVADTGSDLIWAKCGTCAFCAPRGSPSYFPDRSSTFSSLPCADRLCGNLQSQGFAQCAGGGERCVYRYLYGSGDTYAQGYLSSETFTLGGDAAPSIGFGCTTSSEGGFGSGSGVVGLGRGPLSLVSQLNVGAFSYCLNTDPAKASPLLFGSQATLTGAGVQSTPLLQDGDGTYYTVNLRGISIGATTARPAAGNSGIIFDSGTTVTLLADPAYTDAKEAVLSQTGLPRAAGRGGFEACFQLPAGGSSTADPFPPVVLHFDGADMELQASNSFEEVERGVACWFVQKTSGVAIIGNVMQTNFHVRYGVGESMLSFQQADCDSL